MNRFNPLLLLTTALMMAILTACGGKSTSEDPMAQLTALKDQKTQLDAQIAELEKQLASQGLIQVQHQHVGLSEIKPAAFHHYIDLQGRVDASESVMATSRIPGTLRRVLVDNGDRVKAGQLLAEIDDAVMQKNIAELEGSLAVATDLYERQKSLWDQNIGSEVQYIQAKNNKESLERSLATLKENWSMTKVYAPTSGTVDMVMLKQGEAIAPGMPLCNIINLSDLKIVGSVTEAYAAKVKQGDNVKVHFPDLDKEIMTKITYVSRSINPVNRTFLVECKLGTGDYHANMIAVMKIIDYENPKAISIPVNYIQSDAEGEYVLIAEKSAEANTAVIKKSAIKQGQNYNGYVEIVSGLNPGDLLVSSGFQEVNVGETVTY